AVGAVVELVCRGAAVVTALRLEPHCRQRVAERGLGRLPRARRRECEADLVAVLLELCAGGRAGGERPRQPRCELREGVGRAALRHGAWSDRPLIARTAAAVPDGPALDEPRLLEP